MSKNKLFSIVTIACFVSILFIPIGLVLMLYYTDWKKKLKIFLSLGLTTVYALLILFVFFVQPSYNTSGTKLPFGSNSGYTAFDSNTPTYGKGQKAEDSEYKSPGRRKKGEISEKEPEQKLPKSLKKGNGKNLNRMFYSFMFFIFMLFLIIWQNIRPKKKTGYENPYVDTNLYKLPLDENSQMPLVHYLKLKLNSGEKIYFATDTTQKGNEGDFVITNQRVVLSNPNENADFPLEVLEAVVSVTNTVMMLTSGDRKYYIFLHENQMKYALAILRWAVKK